MPTIEEVKQLEEQMEKDMSVTRELIASEKALTQAMERYEKAWGVKVKLAQDND